MNRLRALVHHAFPVLLLLLPSRLKIGLLRLLGHEIGRHCYLGASLLDVSNLRMGDHVHVGHLNVFRRLRSLDLGSGARITNRNYFTGGGEGRLRLGKNASISSGHHMDVLAGVEIGDNTIIAGRGSTFFSHGIAPENLDVRETIRIGDWVYVGSNVKVIPGVTVPSHAFVGMGTVLLEKYTEEYVLIAGAPGRVVKRLPRDCAFFDREEIVHRHRRA